MIGRLATFHRFVQSCHCSRRATYAATVSTGEVSWMPDSSIGTLITTLTPSRGRVPRRLIWCSNQEFLHSSFLLHEDNPVFENAWTADQKLALGQDVNGERYLPIIPLLGNAAVPETRDPWPRHLLDPTIYRDPIEKRFKAIVEFEGSGGIISGTASWLLAHLGEREVAELVINAMTKALTDTGLN